MASQETQYKIAATPQDYKLAHKLLREEGIEAKLAFPTVLAIRYLRTPVGVLARQPRKDAVVAGPAVVSVPGNPVFVFNRLVETFELALIMGGVTHYYFTATDDRLVKALKKLEGWFEAESAEADGFLWFRRNL